jgi:hypothetical protein
VENRGKEKDDDYTSAFKIATAIAAFDNFSGRIQKSVEGQDPNSPDFLIEMFSNSLAELLAKNNFCGSWSFADYSRLICKDKEISRSNLSDWVAKINWDKDPKSKLICATLAKLAKDNIIDNQVPFYSSNGALLVDHFLTILAYEVAHKQLRFISPRDAATIMSSRFLKPETSG